MLDVSATLDTGTKVNVEIQLNNNHDMIKRSLYYWGKLYTSQLQRGMPYSSLHKTITIDLLNFVMSSEYDGFHTTGILWNKEQQKKFSDDIEVHVIEIPKLMRQWREEKINPWEDSFVRWLLLLPANEDEYLTQILEDIAMNQDPILEKAMNKWERMSQDPSFRQAYEVREKALMDKAAKFAHAEQEGLKRGIEKGMKQGIEQGVEQGKMQLIRGMHKNGVSVEDIAKLTGLEEIEIQKFLQD
ncbi:Rpn family recombination-promoting nuclease/putative transposase [Bacillus cereus]|uniref:Rpn family recombination-promoting nuclease/putative transposase n=1 Tax=Bacillus cereus TaxID=1396 RepID=UPI00356F3C07